MAEDIQTIILDASKRMQDVMGDAPDGSTAGQSKGKTEKNLAQQLKKLAGIDLGLGALLKQSQIFTGYMGNLFAIIGAIIDTVLAPLAPIAFKALAALGKKIPAIAKMAEEWIPKVVEFTKKLVTDFDTFMKKLWPTWAGTTAKIIGILIAINLGIKFLRMSGSLAYGITGARGMVGAGKGVFNLASRITGRGSAAAAASRVAAPMISGGGGMGARIGTRAAVTATSGVVRSGIGSAGVGAASRTASQAVGAAPGALAKAAPTGIIGKVASRVGMRAVGRGLVTKIPIIGAIASGVYGYAEGRDKGMSVGKSAARGGFSAGGMLAGAAAGAAIGSFIPGPGTLLGALIGGGIGAFGGGFAFDKLFGGKGGGGGGGGGTSNLGVGGGVGLSGYSVPTFIAMSAEAMSEPVVKFGFVIDENAIQLKNLGDAASGATTSLGEYSAGMREYIEKTGGLDQQDTTDERDWEGGSGAGAIGADYWVKAADVLAAALEKARLVESEIEREKGYMDLPDASWEGGASTAVGQSLFRDPEMLERQRVAEITRQNDLMIQDDMNEAQAIHNAYLAERAADRRAERERQAQIKKEYDEMMALDREETARIEAEVRRQLQERRDELQALIDAQFVTQGKLEDAADDPTKVLGKEQTKEIVQAIVESGGIGQGDIAGTTQAEMAASAGAPVVGIAVTFEQPPATSIGNAWAHVRYGGEEGGGGVWD